MKIKFNIHIMIVKVCENDNKKLDWELEHWPGPWPGPTWTWSLTIMPISHNTTQPPCPPSQNHNYRPSCLSAIMPIRPSDLCPAFATFKPFRLVLLNETFPKPSNSMYLDIRKMIFETPVILHYIRSENQGGSYRFQM